MARQLRLESPGALYHITSRGNLKEKVFFEDSDRKRFLEILRRTKERYGYLLHAYVLMDNHYHLMLETHLSNIAQIMQNINTSYTVYVNRKYDRSGHLFQGRYKSIIVDKDSYLLELSRYIHLNPVRANIVDSPEKYKWSSFLDYCGFKRSELVDITDTLSYFPPTGKGSIDSYREFVLSSLEALPRNPFSSLEAGFILGKELFVKKIRGLLGEVKEDDELPALRSLRRKPALEMIIEEVASYYGVGRENLVRRRKGCRERRIVMYLAKILSRGRNSEVGRQFAVKGAAVSVVVKGIEDDLRKSPQLRREIETIKMRILSKA